MYHGMLAVWSREYHIDIGIGTGPVSMDHGGMRGSSRVMQVHDSSS